MNQWSSGHAKHMHVDGAIQFLTWRLTDSLPKSVLDGLSLEGKLGDPSNQLRIDSILGEGYGSCLLKNPVGARIVAEELLNQHSTGSRLHSFVIMPNHIHAVVTLRQGLTLPKYMQSVKGVSSKRINEALGRSGPLWQKEYFDRVVRDEKALEKTNHYVEWNPVKANLVVDPRDYPYSSAFSTWREKLAFGWED